MSSFLIYAIGLVIVMAGLGARLLGVPQSWIIADSLVVLGLGIAMGVDKTRR